MAVEETDAVISVSRCTIPQFREIYGYEGPVRVVRYHNLELFKKAVPLPPAPPVAKLLARIEDTPSVGGGNRLPFTSPNSHTGDCIS